MRRLVLLGLVAALAGHAAPPAAAAPPGPVPLQRWEVAPSPGGPWRAVEVPHLLDQRPVEERFGGRVAWYRTRVDRPAAPAGFAWAVRFGSVRRTAEVSLDGRPVGRHEDPYVPFTLPLAGLRPRGSSLVVRVDGRKGRQPREGWWNWNGIARPVALVPLGRVVAQHPALLSDVRCSAPGRCTAAFRLDTTLRNRSRGTLRPAVRVRVAGVGVRTVRVRPLAPGETAQVALRVPVPRPRLWAPGRPELYDARIEVLAGGRVEQADRMRAGLRSVAVRDGLVLVNGRVAQLRGASIQEDLPGRGAALRDADVRRIVADLRALGANVTRAHYLLDERLLEALDEAGIMVWSQAPVYHRDALLQTARGRADALESVRGTVLAARRHPSVLTHSVANELAAEPDDVPGTRRFLEAARVLTRRLDPTLPVSVDMLSYPGLPRQRTFAAYDLLGINSYFGWYPGKRDRSTARMEDLGPFLDRMRRMYPDEGLVLTEFGAESTFDGPAHTKETYAFQSRYVRDTVAIASRRRWLGGIIHWTLREFAVKPDWDGGADRRGVARDGIHNKGLLTYEGRPKPAWAVARAAFVATPPLRSDPRLPGADPPAPRRSPAGLLALLALLAAVLVPLGAATSAARALLRPAPRAPRRPPLRALPRAVSQRDAA